MHLCLMTTILGLLASAVRISSSSGAASCAGELLYNGICLPRSVVTAMLRVLPATIAAAVR